MISLFTETLLKYFFLITPFFALSMFLAMTPDLTTAERGRLANRVILSAWIITILLFMFGQVIFRVFGISVDAFRIGAGALLFLSAVSLMNPKVNPAEREEGDDIAVVPLAMPVIIGPATCGPLLVMGADMGITISSRRIRPDCSRRSWLWRYTGMPEWKTPGKAETC